MAMLETLYDPTYPVPGPKAVLVFGIPTYVPYRTELA